MRRDSKLSGVLHVLLHMLQAEHEAAITSGQLAVAMETNPVVIRRIFAGLRSAGFVSSEKGHGGGWRINCDPSKVTLADIYRAVGAPELLAMGHRTEAPGCLVEQVVNARLRETFEAAEAMVVSRLTEVTLADLAADFAKRYRRSTTKQSEKNHGL